MDGTLYLGESPLPNAVDFIKKFNETKKIIFFTNNASKNPEYYKKKVEKLGFPENIDILTSADVLIKYLKTHKPDQKIYLLGTPHLELMFERQNIFLTNSTGEKPDIVVSSFDTTLTYAKLERACTFIRNGSAWLTTHPDINCPVENGGYIPDCGAINALISASTGLPLPKAFGKPYGEVIGMIEEIYGENRENMVIFGDRLYTDTALGKKNGVTAVLLLTGEGTLEDARNLPENLQPDLIFKDLFECEKYFG
ncbi:MAG: HAD hydrolase-like protein [Oscillospiraceae bacterium]|nr:HAD hydrolase-like protein [Oscillospiraceae bacterium]